MQFQFQKNPGALSGLYPKVVTGNDNDSQAISVMEKDERDFGESQKSRKRSIFKSSSSAMDVQIVGAPEPEPKVQKISLCPNNREMGFDKVMVCKACVNTSFD